MRISYSVYFNAPRRFTMNDVRLADEAFGFGMMEVTDEQPHFVFHSIPCLRYADRVVKWLNEKWGIKCFTYAKDEMKSEYYCVSSELYTVFMGIRIPHKNFLRNFQNPLTNPVFYGII